MNFALNANQQAIVENIERLCAGFDLDYWRKRDLEGGFPHDFHAAIAQAGYLGIAMPTQHGGAGLGITEAVLVMQAISQSGAGLSGASAVHMNIFGLHPVVVFGTPDQQARWLPRSSAASRRRASVSPSRTPASTRSSSRPEPCATASTTSSAARRSGFPRPKSRTRSCC